MKLKDIILVTGTIEVVTGLRIGGSKEELEIGGIDLPAIRHGVHQDPYIPGSSLKGKMRFMTEWAQGKVEYRQNSGARVHTCDEINCPVCRVFGTTDSTWGPTRLLVRDAFLDEEWKQTAKPRFPLLTETKTENSINRIWGRAEHPRTAERVPAGAVFNLEMIYRVFDLEGLGNPGEDEVTDDIAFFSVVEKALALVQLDSLGASGSRGYGRVRFTGLQRRSLITGESPIDFQLPETVLGEVA